MIKLNDVVITPTIFPDKTSQVWKLDDLYFYPLVGGYFSHEIVWEFESEAEFIHIAQLVDLLRSTENTKEIKLFVPFMPYARQDKEVANDKTFARRTFYNLINFLNFNEVKTIDVHSGLSGYGPGSTLFKLNNISPIKYIRKTIRLVGPTILAFPDKGAKERYATLLSSFEALVFDKVRNQSTGEIEGLTLGEQAVSSEDTVLIVDDICDGGRTFIEAAKILKEKGVTDINLYTTHGIYSKGTQVLRDAGIKRIFNYAREE